MKILEINVLCPIEQFNLFRFKQHAMRDDVKVHARYREK